MTTQNDTDAALLADGKLLRETNEAVLKLEALQNLLNLTDHDLHFKIDAIERRIIAATAHTPAGRAVQLQVG